MQKIILKSKDKDIESWTFRNSSNKKFTHGLHMYPARMHPEIAKKIIVKYAKKNTIVTDPFMGSGGVLIESMLNGNNAIGFDLNPFAILLSKVKTTIINPNLTTQYYIDILKKSTRDYYKQKYFETEIPTEFNVEFWHKPNVIKKISILKHHIFNLDASSNIKDFFKISLSQTIRNSSNQRKNEFKNYRIAYDDLIKFSPNVFELFSSVCKKNIELLADFKKEMHGEKSKSIIKFGNAKNFKENFDKIQNKLDNKIRDTLIVTSPPYGDHKTTVAYGQFSRHLSHWLELDEKKIIDVDKKSLGGSISKESDLDSKILKKIIKDISKKNPKRALDVFSFFNDFNKFLEQASKIDNARNMCLILGNRTVCNIKIPTDKIVTELAKNHRLKHINTQSRFIISKRIPFKNSPSNVSNMTGNTMSEELIMMFRN